ncbi:MAG: hypothetical protein HUK22_07770 [Thermoguttaceae bacterium]|nr:hypothetical protein [Thermoguttaceae bacterium]
MFDAPQKTVKWSDRLKFWRNQETDDVENELRDALFKGNGAYVEEAVAAIRDNVKKEDGKKFWRMAATSLSAVAALILFGFCFAVYAIFRAFDGKKELTTAPAPR